MEHTSLYKAFEYWARNCTMTEAKTPAEKIRLEQEYLEYLVDNMGDN